MPRSYSNLPDEDSLLLLVKDSLQADMEFVYAGGRLDDVPLTDHNERASAAFPPSCPPHPAASTHRAVDDFDRNCLSYG